MSEHNHVGACAACDELLASEIAARNAAEAADRAKDDFFLTLSHELRGPLNAIMSWTRILGTEGLDGATQKRALATIDRNVKAQTRLISDMFEVSRVIGHKIHLERAPAELAALIQQSVDTIGPAAGDREIVVVTEPGPGAVLVDADRLRQVLENLLLNAIKFTPRGGLITVTLAYRDGTPSSASATPASACERTWCRTSSSASGRTTRDGSAVWDWA